MKEQTIMDAEVLGEYAALPLAYVAQGLIRQVNRAFEELFTYSRQDLVGRRWEDFRQDVFAGEMDICAEGVSHCLRLQNAAGHGFWASLQGKAVDDKNPQQGVVWTIQDVTAQKHAAEALQRAKLEADKATRAKGEFLANMSHEIRTPMNVIIGMTGLALDHEMEDKQRGYLQNVKDSANALLALLNDILDYSKVESGCLRLENRPFDFSALVDGVVSTFRHGAEEKGLYLRSKIDLQTADLPAGDALRLRQILVNLVNNGLKFTREGGVTVEACLADRGQEGLAATFRVRDSGIGIAPENQELIFTSFAQADSSTSRMYGGTGLGLAICRQLVDLMEGSMALESQPGVGSVFSVTVKLAKQAACSDQLSRGGAARHDQCQPCSAKPQTILLADDHLANQQLAKALLEKAGHKVSLAANGLQVLERLAVDSFDHILMDIQMPVLDGLVTTEYIRALERGEKVVVPGLSPGRQEKLRRRLAAGHVHVIAITANAMPEEKEHCLAAGLDSYLAKPYDKDSLLAMVSRGHQAGQTPYKGGLEVDLAKVSRLQVWQHVSKVFELDAETADLVVATYARTLGENFSSLHEALGQADYQQIKHQAHTIKGAFLNLGLSEYALLAADMEKRAAQMDADGFAEMVAAIEAGLQLFWEEKNEGEATT